MQLVQYRNSKFLFKIFMYNIFPVLNNNKVSLSILHNIIEAVGNSLYGR